MQNNKRESMSKKGYGNGFISKLKRFKEGKDFGFFLNMPGPGAYKTDRNALNLEQNGKLSRNSSIAKPSSFFASKTPQLTV